MTTDTQTAAADTGGRTPGEQAYFSSGGLNAEALGKEFEAEAAKTSAQPSQTTQEPAAATAKATGQAGDDDGEDVGAITIDGEGKARDTKGRFVPEAAFLRIKGRAKAVTSENRELLEKHARIEGRMQQLLEIVNNDAEPKTAEQPTAKAKPDKNTDVFAYLDWLESELETAKADSAKQGKQTAEQLEAQNINSAYEKDVARITASKPDYTDAFNHLALTRAKELVVLGFVGADGKPDIPAIQKQIGEEARQIISQAVKSKRSPAETVYALASAKGYVAKAKEAAKETAKSNGQNTDQSAAAQQIAAIQKGMDAGKSLSDAGGSSPNTLTLDALARMDDAEFAAVSAKVRKRLLGG